MPLEPIGDNYFDTAQRAERLQLLLHLLRNTDDAIYLRAPSGAGKTRFAHRLLDILGSDTATVWIRGGTDTDLVDAAVDQLGLTIGELADWPGLVFSALGDQDLLVVVDDADVLAPQAIVQLAIVHQARIASRVFNFYAEIPARGKFDRAFEVGPSFIRLATECGWPQRRKNTEIGVDRGGGRGFADFQVSIEHGFHMRQFGERIPVAAVSAYPRK